jgi:glucose-1-phosphate cytidylyltransferase
MVEIGGRPILWHIMKTYSHYGFNKFVLCLGYKGNMIKDYFLDYEAMNNDFTIRLGAEKEIVYHNSHQEQDFEVTLVNSGLDSMTGGRIKRASSRSRASSGISDIPRKRSRAFHARFIRSLR